MCALASSIWIISYEWVKKSLQSKDPVNEVNIVYLPILVLVGTFGGEDLQNFATFSPLNVIGLLPVSNQARSGLIALVFVSPFL